MIIIITTTTTTTTKTAVWLRCATRSIATTHDINHFLGWPAVVVFVVVVAAVFVVVVVVVVTVVFFGKFWIWENFGKKN